MERKNTIATRTVRKNLAIDDELWQFNKEQFDIAYRFSSIELSRNNPEFFNETHLYFDVQFYFINWERMDDLGEGRHRLLNRTLTPMNMIPCSADRFNNLTDQTNNYGLGPDYKCPEKIDDLYLLGSESSENRKFMKLVVRPCN